MPDVQDEKLILSYTPNYEIIFTIMIFHMFCPNNSKDTLACDDGQRTWPHKSYSNQEVETVGVSHICDKPLDRGLQRRQKLIARGKVFIQLDMDSAK